MFISVFDVFKIGIGPSSSHTVGPMVAAASFLQNLRDKNIKNPKRLHVRLYGSLAFTGKGHASDRAIMLGLCGEDAASVNPDDVDVIIENLHKKKSLKIEGLGQIEFDPDNDLIFDFGPPLPGHANGMKFVAYDDKDEELALQIYYSIGGGFVATAQELEERSAFDAPQTETVDVPYAFTKAKEMLEMGQREDISIANMKRRNECQFMDEEELDRKLDQIWNAMDSCIKRGLQHEGSLPGGLNVKRRAAKIHKKLISERGKNRLFEHTVMDWLGVYAMAINEENAAGGRVVTAPTNGAAGVIPAVGRYYLDHCPDASVQGIRDYLLVAATIGGIIKHNASISGAEVGCQGEVGSASAMAAAGLCAVLGGSNDQIENAAEIALEHHLGMTCDPIGGLVQVPCIERNGLGAVKAVTAASLALRGDGSHFVPLDDCIETMRQTGIDMSNKYKETSTGGLAVNVVEC